MAEQSSTTYKVYIMIDTESDIHNTWQYYMPSHNYWLYVYTQSQSSKAIVNLSVCIRYGFRSTHKNTKIFN